MEYISIAPGVTMPRVGLGTFMMPDAPETAQAVQWALELGYRHLDCAWRYQNEWRVREGIERSGVPREQIFITGKLWNDDVRARDTRAAFERECEALGTDYLDLYLIHYPAEGCDEAWAVMEDLLREGRVRAIGVSNFHDYHMRDLLSGAHVRPAVDQVESNAYFQNEELRRYIQGQGMTFEPWMPLGGTKGHILEDPVLARIGAKHGKTPAQVTIRWHLQRGAVLFPKSMRRDHLAENLEVFDFELDEDDLALIAGMERGTRSGPNPDRFNF